MLGSNTQIRIFATCPQSKDVAAEGYARQVADVARWSEAAGCTGILVYTDNGIVDPWQVAQLICASTERLSPLVAVQPVYMHPYAVAKKISTFAYLYGRRLWINMVSGGFRNDLLALDDDTPHDDRYTRLIEYTTIIRRLLATAAPVTFEGKYYRVKNLKLTPPLPPELFPGVTSSGSSDEGMRAAAKIGATAIRYPKPPGEERGVPAQSGTRVGVRVGIIARESAAAAWEVALQRFPEDRKGRLLHQLAMKTSDSEWHRQLSERTPEAPKPRSPYWLQPFQTYKTFCPYLVGDYQQVAELLRDYIAAGFHTFILDIPPSREELEHTGIVFDRASALAAER
ncbi:MAG: LLM class flavin-dependent oxidoreductase [Pseudomonadales bacterium]